jgi:hypothetical protein
MLLLTSCTEASDDGTAVLRNESGTSPLQVVITDTEGRVTSQEEMERVYVFDTQFVDRTEQCLVAQDGMVEVVRSDGSVIAAHRFADRPVCERDMLVLGPAGDLTFE